MTTYRASCFAIALAFLPGARAGTLLRQEPATRAETPPDAAPTANPSQGTPPRDAAEELRALTAQLHREREAWRAREADWASRVSALEFELATEQAKRLERENQWLEFTRAFATLELPTSTPPPPFLAEKLAAENAAADAIDTATSRAVAARRARGEELREALNQLLRTSAVDTLDFLELGEPLTHEGRGFVGPVVGRLVDARGRLVGSLAAERLRLEASHSARTLTLVLENGYEAHGRWREPFQVATQGGAAPAGVASRPRAEEAPATPETEDPHARGGVRRIVIEGVDPDRWIEALPELFDAASFRRVIDDGRWDVPALRTRLNELLRLSSPVAEAGWRVRALGAVVGDTLFDVQLVETAPDGGIARRLFADRMNIERLEQGLALQLRDGALEREGRTAPFLEGRYRIVLPTAEAEAWAQQRVPGLTSSAASNRR